MTRKIKKSLALILSILMLMSVVPMNISLAAEEGEFKYVGASNGIKVTNYLGSDSYVYFPDEIDGKYVTVIGGGIFQENDDIVGVTFGRYVHTIGQGAFYKASNLTYVSIPKSVKNINKNAFNYCKSLTNVYFEGTEEEWNNIEFATGNDSIINAENIVFYNGDSCKIYGHYLESFLAKEATCTEEGNYEYDVCKECGVYFVDGNETTNRNDVFIPATGHNFTEIKEAVDASCVAEGNHAYWYCATCETYFADEEATTKYDENNSYIIPTNENHNFKDWYSIAGGKHKRYCLNYCGYEETQNCSDSATDNDCLCDACGVLVAHDFVDATCSAPKTCRICIATEGGLNANNHSLTKTDATPYTCTTNGNKDYWHCSLCDTYFKDAEAQEVFGENEWVTVAAHKITSVARTNPSCTKEGISAHFKCTVCKSTFKDKAATTPINVVIPAEGHKTTKVDAVAKTCTTDGNIEHWNCTVCNEKFEDQEATKSLKDVVVPASHEMKFVEDVRATCTSEGKKEHYLCTACSKIFGDINGKIELDEREITTVKPHDGYSEKAKAPTCTEDGHITYVGCYTCGKLFTDKDFKTEIKIENTVIPALTHDWSSNYIDGKDGKHYKPCRRNGCNAVNEDSAEAHVWNSGEIIKDSTCTELGTMKYTCTIANCNATRTEEIEKKPHTEVYYEQPATCTESGKKGETWCTVCKQFTAEAEIIPATGHAWVGVDENYKAATCTTDASGERKCSVCGLQEVDTTLAHHTYPEAWTPNKPATCTKEGEEIKLCEVCKTPESVISNSIPALNHKGFDAYTEVDKLNVTAGTCTAKATYYEVTYCRGCDTELTRVKKTGDKDFTNHIDIETGLSYGETTDPENYVPGNCITKATWDEVTRCNGCNEVIRSIPQEDATVGDHNLVKTNAVAPTCEEDGNIDYWTCSLCYKIYSDEDAEAEITLAQTVDAALGHIDEDFDHVCDNGCDVAQGVHADAEDDDDHVCDYGCGEVLEDCVDGADNNHDCDICGAEDVSEHDFADATCIDKKICRVCEAESGSTNPDNHVGGVRKVEENVVAGTCKTERTWNEVTYCKGCDAKLSTEPKTGAKDTTNHVGGVHTEIKNIVEGTCNAAKTWNEVKYCNGCNAELDSVAKTGNKNPANHVGGERKVEENVVAGTCKTERKWNEVTYCKGCNDKLKTEPKTGSKDLNNHKWSEEVTEHYRECENGCNAKLPVDHSYEGDFRTIKEATCKEAGLKVKYCKYCHNDVEFEIAKTNNHTDNNKDYKCDLCEIELEKPEQDEAGTDNNKPAQNPSANCSCSCHKSGMANLVFRIILFFQKLFGANKTCDCGKSHY